MSIINLKLLILVDKQLWKTKEATLHSKPVFDRLVIVVIISNFYQFALKLGKTFEKYLNSYEKVHNKKICNRFI